MSRPVSERPLGARDDVPPRLVLDRPGDRWWAVAAAVATGMAWGLAAQGWGGPLPLLAVPAGLFLGWVWRRVTVATIPRLPRGTAGVLLLVLALLTAGLTESLLGRRGPSRRDLDANPGLVWAAVQHALLTEGDPPPPVAAPPAPPGAGLDLAVLQEIDRLNANELGAIVERYVDDTPGRAVRRRLRNRTGRLAGWLFLIGGAWLAMRVASRPPAPVVDDDE